jgi:hypothetical protein
MASMRGMSISVSTVIACAMALAAPGMAAADWAQPSGAALNIDPTKQVEDPKIAVVAGVPYVAWQETDSAGVAQVRVKRLEGNTWVEPVPGSLNIGTGNEAGLPRIASVAGVPYVAWNEGIGATAQIRVKRLEGDAWVEPVPGPLNVGAFASGDVSVTDVGGVPYVAFNESDGTHIQIRVKRLEGGAWVEPVAGSLNVDAARDGFYAFVVDVGGVPYVSWAELNGFRFDVFVKRLEGGAWVEPDPGALNFNLSDSAGDPRIAAVAGVPYVSWEENGAPGWQMRVKRLEGTGWTSVGASPSIDTTQISDGTGIADVGGTPFVVWGEGTAPRLLHVAQFAGGSWIPVGGALNVDASEDIDDPALIGVGGVPYAVWAEHVGGDAAASLTYVKRLEPSFTALSSAPALSGATLTAQIDDFGVPLPIGFQLGTTPAFGTTLPLQMSAGTGPGTISATASALAPGTAYSWDAFGSDTFRATSVSPTQTFTTLGGTTPTPTPTSPIPVVVRLDQLRISPSKFRAAASGPTVRASAKKKKAPIGSTISYRLSGAGTAHFTIERARPGFRNGSKCVAKKPRSKKKPKRCTRFTAAGSFAAAGAAGANSLKFSARVNNRKLGAGKYRLTAIGDTGTPSVSARFTIVR